MVSTVALVPGSLGLLSLCGQRGNVLAHLGLCQPCSPPPKSSSYGAFKSTPDTETAISHLPAIDTMRCLISLILGLLALEVALARNLQEQVLNSGRHQLLTLLQGVAWRAPQTDPSCLHKE